MSDDTEKLVRDIYADVREIKTKLESDYRALYGNGQPGLVAKVASIEQDVAVIKAKQSWWGSAIAGWLSVVAFIITTIISIIALFKK